MVENEHFETVVDWDAAAGLVEFTPRQPAFTAGHTLESLSVFVMDHRKRKLPVGARSLEAHYGGFVIEQKRAASVAEARRLSLSTPFGSAAETVSIAGHEGRGYPLGPEVDPDDIDGRNPAVVVWSDDSMSYLVASDRLELADLLTIAASLYQRD